MVASDCDIEGGAVTPLGVGVAVLFGVGVGFGGVISWGCGVGGVKFSWGDGVVVSGSGASVVVGMVVGCINSGSVGVLMPVSEGSLSGTGVVVIVGRGGVTVDVGVELNESVGVGDVVCVGVEVGVRQGPNVLRALY